MSQQKPIISIITPVYNTEQFLGQCLQSLFAQTIAQQIEYIFIDDASTDNCPGMLKSAAEQHSNLNIRVVTNTHNQGSAASRNTGIQLARGKYLMFIDSDDWIEPDMAETLLHAATSNNADVVASPFFINNGNNQQVMRFAGSCLKIDINHAPINVLHFSLCNKLTRRSLIVDNHLLAQDHRNCWEDLSTCCRVLALARRNIVVNIPLYHYRVNLESLSHQNHKKRLDDHLYYALHIDEWFRSHGDDFYNKHHSFLLHLKFAAKIKMLRGEPIEITRWKSTFAEVNSHIIKATQTLALPYRIAFILLAICPTPLAIAAARLLRRKAL